jgi:hypothetical protein
MVLMIVYLDKYIKNKKCNHQVLNNPWARVVKFTIFVG